jgi:hypothetical protein
MSTNEVGCIIDFCGEKYSHFIRLNPTAVKIDLNTPAFVPIRFLFVYIRVRPTPLV